MKLNIRKSICSFMDFFIESTPYSLFFSDFFKNKKISASRLLNPIQFLSKFYVRNDCFYAFKSDII